jgi:hypothetical protein
MARSGRTRAAPRGPAPARRGTGLDALGLQPFAVGVGPAGARAGGADVRDLGAALDEKAGDQEFGPFVAGQRDPAADRRARERAADRGKEAVLGSVDCSARDAAGVADGLEPGRRAVVADGGGADDRAAGRLELAYARRVEGVDRGDGGAVERGVELAPLAGRHDRPCGQAQRLQHGADPTGSAGNISPKSATVGRSLTPVRGAATGPCSASLRA